MTAITTVIKCIKNNYPNNVQYKDTLGRYFVFTFIRHCGNFLKGSSFHPKSISLHSIFFYLNALGVAQRVTYYEESLI